MLCQYKNIFGEEKTGLHSYRVFDLAIVDIIFTILGGYLIKLYLLPNYNLSTILIFLFISGIILHRLFCVRTTIDRILFN
jgi:hypothetical protein